MPPDAPVHHAHAAASSGSVPLLLTIGVLLIVAVGLRFVSRRSHVPSVTLLLLFGVAVGPAWLDLLPAAQSTWLSPVTDVSLVMVGFLLGGEFTAEELSKRGKEVVLVSLGVSLATALVVGLALWLLGAPPAVALLLGSIAPATAPAATMAVIKETKADGPFAHGLAHLVALDDIWELILFSFAMAMSSSIMRGGAPWSDLGQGAWELGGGVLLGGTLGLLAAPVTGRLKPGEPTLLEALGLVFLCAGLGRWLGLPPLLAAVVMGSVIANLAQHHEQPFHEIEHIEWPFLVLFFVLAGATLDPTAVTALGVLPVAYILSRVAGRFIGVPAGLVAAGKWDRTTAIWTPLALLPQAGLALGLALMVADRFPSLADQVLPVVIVSSVVFEVFGPPLTRLAVIRSGEAQLS